MKVRAAVMSLLLVVSALTVGGAVVPLSATAATTNVSSCTIINSSGTYQLTGDITNDTASSCIVITASDVVFDGGGYEVNGSDGDSSSVGVLVNNSATNVTVRSVTAINWDTGIQYTAGVSGGTLTDSVARGNVGDGVVMGSDNATVRNVTATGNAANGLEINADDSLVEGANATANGGDGYSLVADANKTVRDSVALRNDVGVDLGGTGHTLDNVTVRNSTTAGVRADGLLLAARDIRVANSTVADTTGDAFVLPDAENLTAENVALTHTTVSFEASGTNLSSVDPASAPELPPGERSVGAFVQAAGASEGAYFNVTFRYTDADAVGLVEDSFAVWQNNGTWTELGEQSGTDAATNRVQYNVTSPAGLYAPLAPSAGSISVRNPVKGEITNHEWRYNVPSSVSGNLTEVRLNYTGTGANLSSPGTTLDSFAVGESTPSTTATNSDAYLNVTLDTAQSLSGGEIIRVTAGDVTNPGATGTFNATVELRNGTATFASQTFQFDLVQGGTIDGTVTNGTSNSALDGVANSGSVSVYNASTGAFVTGSGITRSGGYSAKVPGGSYDVEATADGFERKSKSASVTSGGRTTVDFTLNETGFVNGTVTDTTGATVSGINVEVYADDGTFAGNDTTDAGGNYSVEVGPGKYEVVISQVFNPNYDFELVPGVRVNASETTVVNPTVEELPDKGFINGTLTDADGNPVTGQAVFAHDEGYENFAFDQTNATGAFSLNVVPGTYTVVAPPNATAGRPLLTREDVSVTSNTTTSVGLQYEAPAYINGTVSGASGSVFVVARTDDGPRVNVTSSTQNFKYNVTVPPGTHTVTVYTRGGTAPSKEVSATENNNTETNFTVTKTEVVSQSVEITSGPGNAANLGVRANVSQGLLQAQVVNESSFSGPSVGAPSELEGLGVNKSTTFEINVTVTNFTANSLLWGIDDARFETSANDSLPNATDVTIRGSPVTLQANLSKEGGAETGVGPLIRKSPSEVQWPTGSNDRASVGRNQTVYVGVFDLSSVPSGARSNLNGVSATTNAQRFSLPTVRNESLRVWIAAPSRTVEGTNHGGFYQATIPDAQLDEWGVDDPVVDLEAFYKGQQRDFTVTDTEDGVRIRIENINYSAGTVSVGTSPSAGTSDTSGGGGGGLPPGEATFSEGQARAVFGAGSDVRAVELISPGTDGRLNVQPLGPSLDRVPAPGTPVVAAMDITSPDPSSGTATVQITLSQAVIDRHTVPPERM
ncbi:MAG: beta strand repeat-containing protein, partial [Haloplanus sp.]